MTRHVATLLVAAALGGCVTAVPCAPGPSATACRAARGDKAAQLELGMALESGTGVAVDLHRAARLYAAAAAATSGTTFVYAPASAPRAGRSSPFEPAATFPAVHRQNTASAGC